MSLCPRCAREHPPGEAFCHTLLSQPGAPVREHAVATRVDPPAPEGEDTLAIGSAIGPWTITRFLGAGGMGAVYEATPRTGNRVAIKVLRLAHPGGTAPEARFAEARERFHTEARATFQLNQHKNVVQIIADGDLPDGRPYLVMEFLVGSTLDARLRDDPPSGQELRRLLLQACDGLAAIHGAGIVHRDLKPENMWVVRADDGETSIKLLDFGISKMEGAKKLTQTGVAIGTPYYISPEQLAKQTVDARSDIYTFGVILYEVFAGRLPFLADSPLALVKQIVFDDPPPLLARAGYTISPRLDRLIRDCLAKEPADRPQTAIDLKRRLLAALDEPRQETAVAIASMTAPRRRVVWIVAGSLALALAAVIFVMWERAGATAKSPVAPSPSATAARPAAASPSPVPPPIVAPRAEASAVVRTPTASGAHAARKNSQSASTARTSVSSLPYLEATDLQPGPPPAALAPAPRTDRAPSQATNAPSPPTRAAAPAIEPPKPARPLTPSERDLITDKDILLR
ncbi:MAG: serine/threonine-protein kinase [Polyangia bacterium]